MQDRHLQCRTPGSTADIRKMGLGATRVQHQSCALPAEKKVAEIRKPRHTLNTVELKEDGEFRLGIGQRNVYWLMQAMLPKLLKPKTYDAAPHRRTSLVNPSGSCT